MRRKRLINKRLGLIAVMMILCILAATYIIKTAGNQAEKREMAQSEEAAQAESEADETGETADGAVSQRKNNVYAYRGSADDNLYSMEAYDKAVESGAGAIVLPFVVSQDGTLYVADDDYAQELSGYGGYFSGMTDAQIDELETVAGSKVIRLSDVFEKYGRDVHYIIELKYTGERNLMALRDLIQKNDYADVVSVSSQYFSGLRSLENELPNIPKFFLCGSEDEWGEALNLDYLEGISVNREMMSEERCREAHDKGKKFGAGVLNTEEDIKSAVDMSADFFFTDEAVKAVSIAP